MADDNPLVLQRRLQAELRRLRDERHVTQRQVAHAHDWSTSKVIRLETGATRIGLTDLRALLRYYEVTDPVEIERLESLALASKERTWRDKYRQQVDAQFFAFLGYEATATRMRHVQSLYIPGLLQTEEYMRSIATAYYGRANPIVERTIELRVKRQQIVGLPGLPMTFLLDESVFHRQVGRLDIMRNQIRKLLSIVQSSMDGKANEVTVRYIPFGVDPHRGMGASFTILDVSPTDSDVVVYVEDPVRDILLPRDPTISKAYVRSFSIIEELSASLEETANFLESLLGVRAG